jgi:DNA repair protein RadC
VRAPTCRSGPRERLESRGPGVLSDSELVALLLRTGSRHEDAWSLARHLLEAVGGLRGLESSPAVALEALPGVGPAKAASLRAAIELGRRWVSEPIERGQPFRSPLDVQRHYEPRLRGRDRESFHVVMLDGRHRLMLTEEVSVGTLTASLVHPREVFRQAIRSGAAAILLVSSITSSSARRATTAFASPRPNSTRSRRPLFTPSRGTSSPDSPGVPRGPQGFDAE